MKTLNPNWISLQSLKKMQKKLNAWLQRDLSLRGRILLSKAEGISMVTHLALSLVVSSKKIDNMLFNFAWKNRIHYVKKSVMMNTNQSGGLNFPDFTTLNNTFKIKWLRQFINNPSSLWNFIPNNVFSKIGGLDFLLLCNYNTSKIPIKLSHFHKQVLLAWSLIFKHNFYYYYYFIILLYLEQQRHSLQT